MEYVKIYEGKPSVSVNLLIRENSAQVSCSSQERGIPHMVYFAYSELVSVRSSYRVFAHKIDFAHNVSVDFF